jgi:hypothetical protein
MKVRIISSFAEDRLITEQGTVNKEGGPAFFITRVLDKINVPYNLVCGKKASVEIDMKDMKEIGRIINVDEIQDVKYNDYELILVSTLLDEFKIKACGKFSCLDIQGYVRDGNEFGKKKFFDSPELEKFKIVKGTVQELSYIPSERLERVPIIVATMGEQGFSIRCGSRTEYFTVKKVNAPNNIGAGDTFFAAFCAKYYQSKDIRKSADFAQRFVTDFLKEKMEVLK